VDAGQKLPEPRNEEESIVSYRLSLVENTVKEVKTLLETSNLTVLAYKVQQLEVWRGRILGAVGALAVIVVGALITGDIKFGGTNG
jgi:hypothetical protein